MRQLAILAAALLAAGCSGTRYSGFLGDYSKLRPSTKRPSAVGWEKPGVDMAAYKREDFESLVSSEFLERTALL